MQDVDEEHRARAVKTSSKIQGVDNSSGSVRVDVNSRPADWDAGELAQQDGEEDAAVAKERDDCMFFLGKADERVMRAFGNNGRVMVSWTANSLSGPNAFAAKI
ncbi:uncharacterized protein MEPE_03523 [Melanopsichium pennsylvanicum]|uniref:Uncharacterized protein n=1 Tax=Melanopsichium pennsylvanicum TaxID=63383 RepID=A0AAJ4XLZ7_9BASI|nr:uncharacterized protein MEPE_03523 [Melanopsichium pennsylvanicum]